MGRKKKRRSGHAAESWEGVHLAALQAGARIAETISSRAHQAADEAAQDDRVWFLRHPGEAVRVRQAVDGEFDAFMQTPGRPPIRPSQRLVVLVLQAAPGRRLRLPYRVMPIRPGEDALTARQLADVENDWLASDRTVPVQGADGAVHDAFEAFRRIATRT